MRYKVVPVLPVRKRGMMRRGVPVLPVCLGIMGCREVPVLPVVRLGMMRRVVPVLPRCLGESGGYEAQRRVPFFVEE